MANLLTNTLRGDFDPALRTRGELYFSRGKVSTLLGNSSSLRAVVWGSSRHELQMHWDGQALRVTCDCPVSAGGQPCKHMWATLRAAEEKGLLLPLPGRRVSIAVGEDRDEPSGERLFLIPRGKPHAGGHLPEPWQVAIDEVERLESASKIPPPPCGPERLIRYLINIPSPQAPEVTFSVMFQTRKKNGNWGQEKVLGLNEKELATIGEAEDRHLLGLMVGVECGYAPALRPRVFLQGRRMSPVLLETLLPLLCATGRCFARRDGNDSPALHWDAGPPWLFELEVAPAKSEGFLVRGQLRRGDQTVALADPQLFLADGWMIWKDQVRRLDACGGSGWIATLQQRGSFVIPRKHIGSLIERMVSRTGRFAVQLPEDLRWNEQTVPPQPMATVKNDPHNHLLLRGRLEFAYGDQQVAAEQGGRLVPNGPRQYICRDEDAERRHAQEFHAAGFTVDPYSQRDPEYPYELLISRLAEAARALLAKGWQVRAKGKLYRQPGAFKLDLTSGVDWFELNGGADYNGVFVPLPALLRALREKKDFVTLTDGSLGLLPKEWMDRLGPLAATGELEGDHIRFARRQAGLLDALLAARPEISFDAGVARIREELNSFRDILPIDPPATFQGDLRPYQREGLGWLHFLQKFGFGGCLADDMGLGKTVQVLALLESRRVLREGGQALPPSLVVVPRSLLFNWRREAERFTPRLRLLDHTGLARAKGTGHLQDYDVVLTTYGTLRQDAVLLKDVEFDYLILDESQAVKNAGTQSAKAVRLLNGRHRLAMSGTPIENHVGELWSLFEFLNPGMLGSISAFATLTGDGADDGGRILLSQALRPFILRRTKTQVARDLPARQEETLYCELPPKQRKLYEELRDHYRGTLLGLVDTQGLGRSKIQILEALLRLRQAACHPGLLDPKAVAEESAKLTTLLPQLTELAEEGHKALVFSQFVSFLQIVKKQLHGTGIRYAYLDGKTRDREACVREFQDDPDCRLFLISLKAGGLGLNLTAADYVFLLDPWWNPAVEAQAIDRAHRIGQTQKVFAYRLIAKDTIEEKVLELQKKKRELADAIINADNSLIRGITREDLELLLA